MKPLLAHLRQPTSIMGLAWMIGATVELAAGKIGIETAVGIYSGGLAAVLLPDNSRPADVAQAMAEQVARSPSTKTALKEAVTDGTAAAVAEVAREQGATLAAPVRPTEQGQALPDAH